MNIISELDIDHEIFILQRKDTSAGAGQDIDYTLIDEETNKELIPKTKEVDRKVSFYVIRIFDLTVKANQNISIKVVNTSTNNIEYRGKIFVTSQDTQNYQING